MRILQQMHMRLAVTQRPSEGPVKFTDLGALASLTAIEVLRILCRAVVLERVLKPTLEFQLHGCGLAGFAEHLGFITYTSTS